MKIKKGLEKEYQEYLYKNVKVTKRKKGDIPLAYVLQILTTTELVGEYLDGDEWQKPMAPKEAFERAIKDQGITGFMSGMIAATIVAFHPRGEEFKQWWNEQFGVKEAEGVVNPAIVTIEEKKK